MVINIAVSMAKPNKAMKPTATYRYIIIKVNHKNPPSISKRHSNNGYKASFMEL
jgi:hypothetical protein